MTKWILSQKCKGGSTIKNQCNILIKKKSAISELMQKKALDKFQYPFMVKQKQKQKQNHTQQVEKEENSLNWIKGIYEKLTANIILSDERVNGFPLTTGIRLECLLLPDERHPD